MCNMVRETKVRVSVCVCVSVGGGASTSHSCEKVLFFYPIHGITRTELSTVWEHHYLLFLNHSQIRVGEYYTSLNLGL